jgi:hypothetical protein
MRRSAALAVVLLLISGPAFAGTALAPLASHKALYTMKLNHGRGDVVAGRGTMGYEVIDACDGWAVRQRLDMVVTNAEGQNIEMVSDYATWEAKDGRKFRFHMKQTTDDAVTSQTDGDASIDKPGGPGIARYTTPSHMTKQLPPGTLFPMAHTAAIIAAASEGKKILNLPLFDGTSEAGAEDSSIVVTSWDKPMATKWPVLSKLPSARVTLAFYDWSDRGMMPDYQVAMRYWENGVADDLTMDFGDFVMNANMTEFSPQPSRC